MSKYELLIKAVTIQGLSYGQVARLHGVSKTLVHKLHHRWLTEGDAAFEPHSRRPRSSPNRTPPEVTARVLELRDQLVADGHDAGADTICDLLAREAITLSTSASSTNLDATVLTHDGLVLAEFTLNPDRDYQPKTG